MRLAEWASALRLEDVPAPVVAAAKLHLLDAFGTGLAALELGAMAAPAAVAGQLGGEPEATALGVGRRIGAAPAALANGAWIHALDFDDTHEATLVHSSAVVAPAMLAVGEAVGAGGEEMLAAALAGYEVGARVGLGARGALHLRGFHPTSVCCVFAAATVAAKLRGLDPGRTAAALGIAGSQASGVMEYLADGSQTKPLHAGWAAFSGIVAAALAAHGASGPATVLEGRFGVLAAHADELDPAALTADLGSRWETLGIAFKPYPSCHCGHAVLDAVAACEVEAGEVEEVVALAPGAVAIGLVLEPAAEKLRPRTPYDAKFSLPYCIAALLLRGELGLDAFTEEAIADPRALALAARVGYEEVDFPGGSELSGGVRIRTAAGSREERLTQPRGAPGNPLDPAAVEAKFRRNASPALGAAGAEALREVVATLERRDAAGLAAALAARGAGLASHS